MVFGRSIFKIVVLMSTMLPLLLTFLSIALLHPVLSQEDLSKCSATKACYQGCCSKDGNCGFGPDFCGDGCQGNCDAQAECGKYAPDGKHDCPINVCCRFVATNGYSVVAAHPHPVNTVIAEPQTLSVAMAVNQTAKVEVAVRLSVQGAAKIQSE